MKTITKIRKVKQNGITFFEKIYVCEKCGGFGTILHFHNGHKQVEVCDECNGKGEVEEWR